MFVLGFVVGKVWTRSQRSLFWTSTSSSPRSPNAGSRNSARLESCTSTPTCGFASRRSPNYALRYLFRSKKIRNFAGVRTSRRLERFHGRDIAFNGKLHQHVERHLQTGTGAVCKVRPRTFGGCSTRLANEVFRRDVEGKTPPMVNDC